LVSWSERSLRAAIGAHGAVALEVVQRGGFPGADADGVEPLRGHPEQRLPPDRRDTLLGRREHEPVAGLDPLVGGDHRSPMLDLDELVLLRLVDPQCSREPVLGARRCGDGDLDAPICSAPPCPLRLAAHASSSGR
jgi:hypothetical protein